MKKKTNFELLNGFVNYIKNKDEKELTALHELILVKPNESRSLEVFDVMIDFLYEKNDIKPDWVRSYLSNKDTLDGLNEAVEDIIGDYLTEDEEKNGNSKLFD